MSMPLVRGTLASYVIYLLKTRASAHFEEPTALAVGIQPYLFRELTGCTIHPEILSKGLLLLSLKIADIGTGTGQWLIDVSGEISSARLDGFDISRAHFPAKECLPSGIFLNELDIPKPVPFSLEGHEDKVLV